MAKENYFTFLYSLLNEDELNLNVEKATETILECILNKNSIWIFGNGGSASTAEHFETDLSFVRHDSKNLKIKASALTGNSALITAIANDIGFKNVFSHQLQRKANKGDLCIKVAKQIGLKSIGLLGFDGGELSRQVDFSITVKTEIGKYGPVEDVHLAICHAISENLLAKIKTMSIN